MKECHRQGFHVQEDKVLPERKYPVCAQKQENDVRTEVKRLIDRLSVSLWTSRRGGAEGVNPGSTPESQEALKRNSQDGKGVKKKEQPMPTMNENRESWRCRMII